MAVGRELAESVRLCSSRRRTAPFFLLLLRHSPPSPLPSSLPRMKSLFHKKKSKQAQSSTSISSSPPLPSLPAGPLLSDSPPLLTPPSPLPPWPAPYPTPPPTTSSLGAHPSQTFPSYASSSGGRYGQPQQQPIEVVRPTPVPVGVGASLGRGLMDVRPATSSTVPLDPSSSSVGAGGGAGGGLSVALDFGTTFSGVVSVPFALFSLKSPLTRSCVPRPFQATRSTTDRCSRSSTGVRSLSWSSTLIFSLTSEPLCSLLDGPLAAGSSETFRKIPTCLVYSSSGQILAWGLEAKAYNVFAGVGGEMGEWKCECPSVFPSVNLSPRRLTSFFLFLSACKKGFKLFLEPSVLRRPGGGLQAAFGSVLDSQTDPRLPGLPVRFLPSLSLSLSQLTLLTKSNCGRSCSRGRHP